MVTVCLTSIPPRFDTLPARLGRLLGQRPDRVVLTLPDTYERFPDWDGALPALPAGVTLLRGPDHGPATKFAAARRAFRDADLLLTDDDCDYGPGWIDAFRAARGRHPDSAIAASVFDTARLGLAPGHLIAQGFGGVLLRAEWLPADPPAPPARWVDDIWLSAQLAHRTIVIRPCPEARAKVTAQASPDALQDALIDGQTRAALNREVAHDFARRLGVWTAPGQAVN